MSQQARTAQVNDDSEVVIEAPKSKGFFDVALQNPAPVIGVLATTGILGYGVKSMLSDNKQAQQRMLKGRVYGQAATFGLVIASVAFATLKAKQEGNQN